MMKLMAARYGLLITVLFLANITVSGQCQEFDDVLTVTIDVEENTISATIGECDPCVAGEGVEACLCYHECFKDNDCVDDCIHLGQGTAYYNWCLHDCCSDQCDDYEPLRSAVDYQYAVQLWWTTAWTIPDPPTWSPNQTFISQLINGAPDPDIMSVSIGY